MTINNNNILGVYGKSGSGKTTFIDILSGLIETENSLFVDNIEINKVNQKSWQKNISYCPQNTFLFAGTIEDNIAFGKEVEDIDISRIINVLRFVDLDVFANKLENKERVNISDLSSNISGGQKQKIGIARLLYRNSKILIFDESFSNIDNNSYTKILNRIKEMKNKTIIIISHDQSILNSLDNLFDLENGKYI